MGTKEKKYCAGGAQEIVAWFELWFLLFPVFYFAHISLMCIIGLPTDILFLFFHNYTRLRVRLLF